MCPFESDPLTSLDADTSDLLEITMRGACRVYRGIPDLNRAVTARKRCSNTPCWRLLFEDDIDPTSPKLIEKKILIGLCLLAVYNDSKKYSELFGYIGYIHCHSWTGCTGSGTTVPRWGWSCSGGGELMLVYLQPNKKRRESGDRDVTLKLW